MEFPHISHPQHIGKEEQSEAQILIKLHPLELFVLFCICIWRPSFALQTNERSIRWQIIVCSNLVA